MTELKIKGYEDQMTNMQIDRAPDGCPFCHRDVTPRVVDAFFYDKHERYIQIIFRCPNRSCQKVFVGYYTVSNKVANFEKVSRGNRISIKLPDTINEVSPNFVNIYQQADIAEQEELTEVCGVAYRKSLEFLIKDYVIRKHPSEEEKIKKKFLGNCIKEYVANQNIKTVAERAIWLGNDETHYVRKWETKDLTDLKSLIRITMLWIEMEIETEKIEAEMPSPY